MKLGYVAMERETCGRETGLNKLVTAMQTISKNKP
jgi:hypothetical protein